jgi:hypothetical protein
MPAQQSPRTERQPGKQGKKKRSPLESHAAHAGCKPQLALPSQRPVIGIQQLFDVGI